jgi:tRNA threonylcarbamoyl adenosine modification protein YeaZ
VEPTLAVVACGPQLEVALGSPDLKVPSVVRLAGTTPRSSLLLAAVDLAISDAGLDPTTLVRVVVGRGPGSFTGIRSALATAEGLRAAVGAEIVAYDSLRMQAARHRGSGSVWTAQPGRRGEAYVQAFETSDDAPPSPLGDVEILPLEDASGRQPWLAPETLDLGDAIRARAVVSAAEGLLRLVDWAVPTDPVEPRYVEGPPIHSPAGDRG